MNDRDVEELMTLRQVVLDLRARRDDLFASNKLFEQEARDARRERDTLAEQLRGMRECIEACQGFLSELADSSWEARALDAVCCEQMAAPPTEAEQRVREWKEKAELLDLLVQADGKYAFGRAATAPGYFLMYKDNFSMHLILMGEPLAKIIEALKSDIALRAARKESA